MQASPNMETPRTEKPTTYGAEEARAVVTGEATGEYPDAITRYNESLEAYGYEYKARPKSVTGLEIDRAQATLEESLDEILTDSPLKDPQQVVDDLAVKAPEWLLKHVDRFTPYDVTIDVDTLLAAMSHMDTWSQITINTNFKKLLKMGVSPHLLFEKLNPAQYRKRFDTLVEHGIPAQEIADRLSQIGFWGDLVDLSEKLREQGVDFDADRAIESIPYKDPEEVMEDAAKVGAKLETVLKKVLEIGYHTGPLAQATIDKLVALGADKQELQDYNEARIKARENRAPAGRHNWHRD